MLKGVLMQQINIQSASYLKSGYVGLLLPEARKGTENQKEHSKQTEENKTIESKPRQLLLIIEKLVVCQECACQNSSSSNTMSLLSGCSKQPLR